MPLLARFLQLVPTMNKIRINKARDSFLICSFSRAKLPLALAGASLQLVPTIK